MSVFDDIETGPKIKPLFMLIYAEGGIGKTTIAESFPRPLFFDFENSSDTLDVSRIRRKDWNRLFSDLEDLLKADELLDKEGNKIHSLVFDTIDKLEKIMHFMIAANANKMHIDQIGWQKGYAYAEDWWFRFIMILRDIRDKHNCHILLLAHAKDCSDKDYDHEVSYVRTQIGLKREASKYVFGQIELVLLAKKDITFKKSGDNVYAVDIETRYFYTTKTANHDAKNRIGLPPKIEIPTNDAFGFIWGEYRRHFEGGSSFMLAECKKLLNTDLLEDSKKADIISYIESQSNNKSALIAAKNKIHKLISSAENKIKQKAIEIKEKKDVENKA